MKTNNKYTNQTDKNVRKKSRQRRVFIIFAINLPLSSKDMMT